MSIIKLCVFILLYPPTIEPNLQKHDILYQVNVFGDVYFEHYIYLSSFYIGEVEWMRVINENGDNTIIVKTDYVGKNPSKLLKQLINEYEESIQQNMVILESLKRLEKTIK